MAVRVTVKYTTGTAASYVDKHWVGTVSAVSDTAIIAAIRRERAYEANANIVITQIKQG